MQAYAHASTHKASRRRGAAAVDWQPGARDAATVTTGDHAAGAGGHDFAQVSLLGRAEPSVQTKLTVGPAGDEFEQEADRVAEQVMRAPEPGKDDCSCGGTCNDCQGKSAKRVQAKPLEADGPDAGAAPPIVQEALAGSGAPLDSATRAFMEPRFGHDFSQVRVHTDPLASSSAGAVSARAYTVGADIVFREGQYSPATDDGRRLLAHELTHVVQQRGR
jgi:hypothetical protein